MPCPFCEPQTQQLVCESDAVRVLRDQFPVSPGHTLIVPRRHVASVFDLPSAEYSEIWRVVAEVREDLIANIRPNGFNVGMNDGDAAGQTVRHAHIHLIPRFTGDVADPRGGVRWILPAKADYWSVSEV